jgi:hypothetical protein
MRKIERGRLPEWLTAIAIFMSAAGALVSGAATYWYAKTTKDMHEAQQAPYLVLDVSIERDDAAKDFGYTVDLLNVTQAPALRVACKLKHTFNGVEVPMRLHGNASTELSVAIGQRWPLSVIRLGRPNFDATVSSDVAILRFTCDCDYQSRTGHTYSQHWSFIYDRVPNLFRVDESTGPSQ